ncbi:MAG: TonB-dependent receptor [Rikenellaceae bacterium]
MNRFLLLFVYLVISSSVMAQSKGSLKLRVIDSDNNQAMVGTVVSITDDGVGYYYNTTDSKGDVLFPNIDYGDYALTAIFMGYDTVRRNVVINSNLVDLGTVGMQTQTTAIDRVSIQANAIRTSINGDTVIYNADAYKVSADAVAEGLLAKMPGITVDDGEVEAQGESVKKVFLDGKEFFGEDVTLAVKNIPADIIAKVEVFNKLSDEAEFTGFDDGNSYKAINFVTRTGMNSGHFGKFTAGYASEDLYQASASYNYFTNNHRISIIGSSNNMNIRGFGSMEVGGSSGGGGGGGRSTTSGSGSFSGASSGLSSSSGIGFNYGGEFLESKLKLEASYFYNTSDNQIEKLTDRQYITDQTMQRYYDAISESSSDNYNHRVNALIEFKPNSRHSIMMRPEFAYQDSGSLSYSLVENSQSSDGVTFEDLNQIESLVTNDKEAFSVSNNLVYRALIGQTGRNIMLSFQGSYSENDTHSLNSNTTSYADSEDNITKQDILNGTKSYNLSSSLTYSEPIFEKSAMLNFKYNVGYKFSDADYLVYEWEQYENMFNPDYDPTSSNIYNSGYLTHNIGPGIMYSKPGSLQLNANVSYQISTLANQQEIPVIDPDQQEYSFNNFIYSMMMRKTFNSTNSLRVMLNSSTENPSVSQLQDVVKDSDPQNVSSGNSLLEPSYSNSLRATFTRSNIMKGRTFMAMLNASYTSNTIGESTIMLIDADDTYTLPNGEELEQFGQYTKPVNLDNEWNVGASFSYGTPVYLLYSNLNFDFGVNYSQSPSILNGIENISQTTTYKSGLSLGSNISENADFTLSYSGSYNIASYKGEVADATSLNNEYLSHKASAQFKFVLWGGITFFGDATYSQYKGITDDFNQEYLLCNASIGKKVFKNQRGEISFGVNDIFNQTESFVRNITESYIENVVSNSLSRYYGFKFTFDLRNFNGQSSPRGSGSLRDEGGMRGGGMDGGGMGRMRN